MAGPTESSASSRRRAARVAGRIAQALSAERDVDGGHVLAHLASFAANLGALLDLARYGRLTLGRFRSNEALEFYCDVSRAGMDLGFVAKGWNDPGIRVGDLIFVARGDVPTFEAGLATIANACASCGVCWHFRSRDGGLQVELWTPVYGSPFAPNALTEALLSLRECERRIRRLCRFTRTPPARRHPLGGNGIE